MKLMDELIQDFGEVLKEKQESSFSYNPEKCWPENDGNEIILSRDMAYELGGSGKPAVHATVFTSDESNFTGDQVFVIGKDLTEIKENTEYARVAVLLVDDMEGLEQNDVYLALQEIDFVKYHVNPNGFMMRTSGQSRREQVRISKKALEENINFEGIGNTLISHYKESDHVKAVKIYFITAPEVDYKALEKIAFKSHEITLSLSKIMKGIPTECAICDIKEI